MSARAQRSFMVLLSNLTFHLDLYSLFALYMDLEYT